MIKSRLVAATAVLAAAVSFSTVASATVFNIDYDDAGVWNAYDENNETYGMKFRADQGKDGFWLVVTDGANPKGDGTSNAILYGDLKNNRITAYTYNGENNAESYEAGQFLGTFEDAFSSGGTHPEYGYEMTMFSLDVSGINNALGDDFQGVAIGEKAGIWFHQSTGSQFTYAADGSLADYGFQSQVWLDRGSDDIGRIRDSVSCSENGNDVSYRNLGYLSPCGSTQIAGGITTTSSGGGSVPAPGGLALLLVGLAGLGFKMRGKKA